MALGKDIIATRLTPEKVVMENQQFAKWSARRKGVSAKALATALNLLSDCLVEAMAEGYAVRWWRLGTFECREVAPRRRYHRIKKEVYTSPANTIVHFKKSENLNSRVRKMSKDRLEKMLMGSSVPLAVRK